MERFGMIHSGLASITFRKLKPNDVVSLAAKSGLEGVEWGGDVHVPHGNLKTAKEVYRMTIDSGLKVASYGSYYYAGGKKNDSSFEAVLATANELHAPVIRVWAGEQASQDADTAYRECVVRESRRIAELARGDGVTIAYEFHGGTLTDNSDSAVKLLQEVAHEAVKTYWQPPVGRDFEYCLGGLKKLLPWLANIHAFHWGATHSDRRALADGAENWKGYLSAIASTGREHFVMIEFVRSNDPEMFLEDAAALRKWIGMNSKNNYRDNAQSEKNDIGKQR